MTALGGVGYATFHGHKKNEDCWLCPYKGWVFLGSSIALGICLAFQEQEQKD